MAIRNEKKTFDFNDVMLVPKKGILKSRSSANTSVKLGNREFAIPAVPANMSTIIDEPLAEWLAERNYFYVMHRFDVDPVAFTKRFQDKGLFASVSLGVKAADYAFVDGFVKQGIVPEYVTVDVAHGHADTVVEIVKYIKEQLPETYVIAGNVGAVEGALGLEEAGADCIKVGIGPGCFAPNSLIRTKNGLKEIQNVVQGDEVLTHTGQYQKVLNKFEYEHHEELIEINGIKSTPEHEFYVCNKVDQNKITEKNYQDYCYWVEAHTLDAEKHFLIEIED